MNQDDSRYQGKKVYVFANEIKSEYWDSLTSSEIDLEQIQQLELIMEIMGNPLNNEQKSRM